MCRRARACSWWSPKRATRRPLRHARHAAAQVRLCCRPCLTSGKSGPLAVWTLLNPTRRLSASETLTQAKVRNRPLFPHSQQTRLYKLMNDQIQQEAMGGFPGLQYCKTDLMAEKGIVFCKYCRASQALAALEAIGASGMVRTAGHAPH